MFNNIFRDKKILITGHAGFKGSWLCVLLKSLGARLYGYSLLPSSSPRLYEIISISSMLEDEIIADILDERTFNSFVKKVEPDLVIHLAAQPLVIDSYNNPIGTYKVNVIGTLNVLEACRAINSVKAVINITTDKCYENYEDGRAYKENDPFGGYDMYSSSKACSEILTASYRRSFLSDSSFLLASARAGNVIGGGDWSSNRLVPDCMVSFSKNEKVVIRKPNANRPWQFVLEPLVGYLCIAQKLLEGNKDYARGFNIGPDINCLKSVKDIAFLCKDFWGKDASVIISENADFHEATALQLDSSLSKKMLGVSPVWNIDIAVEKTVEWYKTYYLSPNQAIDCTHKMIEAFINTAIDKNFIWTK